MSIGNIKEIKKLLIDLFDKYEGIMERLNEEQKIVGSKVSQSRTNFLGKVEELKGETKVEELKGETKVEESFDKKIETYTIRRMKNRMRCKAKSMEDTFLPNSHKKIQKGDWVYGYLVITSREHRYIFTGVEGPRDSDSPNPWEFVEVDPATIRQWACKDKEKQDVYEQDLIQYMLPFSYRERYNIHGMKEVAISRVYWAGTGFCVSHPEIPMGIPLSKVMDIELFP